MSQPVNRNAFAVYGEFKLSVPVLKQEFHIHLSRKGTTLIGNDLWPPDGKEDNFHIRID